MFYKETNFKETPIGRIPSDWAVENLGDDSVAHIIMGQSPPSSTYNKEGKGLPFFQGKMEFRRVYPTASVYCSKPIKIAQAKDVLVSVRAPVGDVNVSPFSSCIGRGLAAIRAKEGRLNYLFLFYCLSRNRKRFDLLSGGSTFKGIRRTELQSFLIPFPAKLKEQQKVAEVLSTVDETIEKTNEVIAKTERLKKGLMQELLTNGIGHKEFKDTEAGRIPKEWDTVKLVEILTLEYGKGLSQKERVEGEYPVCGSNGIIGYHNKFLVNGPGIVVGRKGTMGAVSWIDSDFWPIDTTYFVKVNRDRAFLKWLFFKLAHIDLKRLTLSDVVPGLKRTLVYPIRIGLPPLHEQQKIAEILSTVDKKLEVERSEKAKLERIKQGLMDLLLTGKVRVRAS